MLATKVANILILLLYMTIFAGQQVVPSSRSDIYLEVGKESPVSTEHHTS
jgi:hypothetical protein